jgi:hypothetical protein
MELHTVFFRGKYRRNEADIFFFFLCAFFVSKSIGNNIFLLPTDLQILLPMDLPTDKKLPTKDISPTEHFRQ